MKKVSSFEVFVTFGLLFIFYFHLTKGSIDSEFDERDFLPNNYQTVRQSSNSFKKDCDTTKEECVDGKVIMKEEDQFTPVNMRPKRYPQHLDPNRKIGLYPFWLKVGECPSTSDGLKKHFCPSPTSAGKWVCIDDYQLCDSRKDCPMAEDENTTYCMFFRSLKSEVELLTKTVSALSTSTSISLEDYPISAAIRKYENVKFPWKND